MKPKNRLTRWSITVLFSVFITALPAQENLIPNPSFESFSSMPTGWFFNGNSFNKVVRYWTSPTLASPDAFGPSVPIPANWSSMGMGDIPPKVGIRMVGFTNYGCDGTKPHCREYLQVPLIEPLVVGQKYRLSFFQERVKRINLNNHLQYNHNELNNVYDK